MIWVADFKIEKIYKILPAWLEKEPIKEYLYHIQIQPTKITLDAAMLPYDWSIVTVVPPGRTFTYEKTSNTDLHAMLNSNDTSEYLKISTDGLEVGVH